MAREKKAEKAPKNEVSALEVIAASIVGKQFKDEVYKAATHKMEKQTFDVKMNVEVYANVSVGESTSKVSTVNVLSVETLAIALYCAGVTREAAMKAILKAVGKTMNKKNGKALTAKEIQFAEYVNQVMEVVKGRIAKNLPKTPVSPRLTINDSVVKFSPIESDQEEIEQVA